MNPVAARCLLTTFSLLGMENEDKPTETTPADEKKQQKKRNYRKDKPWDGDHIDHWKIEVRAAFSWLME